MPLLHQWAYLDGPAVILVTVLHRVRLLMATKQNKQKTLAAYIPPADTMISNQQEGSLLVGTIVIFPCTVTKV